MLLPTYVPGSRDHRVYRVGGVTLNVVRGAGQRSVGFNGGGRDGDYVPEGAPEPAALNEMVAGVAGVSPSGPTDCAVASEEALAAIEARMAEASGGVWTITRDADGRAEVARALLDAPVMEGMARTCGLRGAWSLSVVTAAGDGDATATPWAWGKDPGDWLATTLAAMGVAEAVASGAGNGAARVVPRGRVRELVERALENPLLGAGEFRMTDARVRR
jgi:hypothetical protein